jgi:hypothetical protein
MFPSFRPGRLPIALHPYLVKLTMQIIDTGPSVAFSSLGMVCLLPAWNHSSPARLYALAGILRVRNVGTSRFEAGHCHPRRGHPDRVGTAAATRPCRPGRAQRYSSCGWRSCCRGGRTTDSNTIPGSP